VTHIENPAAQALGTDERERAVDRIFSSAEWTTRTGELPEKWCVHTRVEQWAEQTPEAIAIVQDERSLTYRELNQRANQLAWFLRKRGVDRGTLVAICAERSIELVVGQLGILKAGGAYVPLDAAYPADRIRFMLGDTNAPVILTQRSTRERLPPVEARIVCLESDWPKITAGPSDNLPNFTTGGDLAYVIYTSGSTGRPKGVMVPHRGVLRLVSGQDYVSFTEKERFLVAASPSFDGITFEVWGALINGGACVVFSSRWHELPALEKMIRGQGVTSMFLTTSLFNQIIDLRPETLAIARDVVVGGEALSASHIRRAMAALPGVNFINGYGPTECTTFAAAYRIEPPDRWQCASVPIGRPLNHTECHIVDEAMQPVPVGATGELLLGGAGLARGYLNQPELTEEKFIRHPWSADPDARLYRTGDLCRWLPNGLIEYIGRADEQVKLRGFRIELGEIEAAARESKAVGNAVAVARSLADGRRQLVVFAVPRGGLALSAEHLLGELRARLPEHMVPARVEVVGELPLTKNGKVDRRALGARLPTAEGILAATDDGSLHATLEAKLVQEWRNVLRQPRLGPQSDFFREGGDSLLAVRLALQLERALRRPVSVGTIHACSTPTALAAQLASADGGAPALRGSGPAAPLFFVPGIFGTGRMPPAIVERLHGRRCYFDELQYPGCNSTTAPLDRIEALAATLIGQVRAVYPKGPLCLLGYSMGGIVAYEMSCQLRNAGRSVEVVIIGDSAPASVLPFRGRWERGGMRFVEVLRTPLNDSPAKIARFARWARGWASQLPRSDGEMPSGFSPVESASLQAYENYQPSPYAGRVALLKCKRARSIYRRAPTDADYGWRRWVTGELSIHEMTVSHEDLFKKTGGAAVADLLDAILPELTNGREVGVDIGG